MIYDPALYTSEASHKDLVNPYELIPVVVFSRFEFPKLHQRSMKVFCSFKSAAIYKNCPGF
jgi:hypothetical protein